MKILTPVLLLGFAFNGFSQKAVVKTFNLPQYTLTDSLFATTLHNVLLSDTSCLKGGYVFQLSSDSNKDGTNNVRVGWYPVTESAKKCTGYFMVGDRPCIIDSYNNAALVEKLFAKTKATKKFSYKEVWVDGIVKFAPEEFSMWFFDYDTNGLKLTEHYCVH